MSSGGQKADDAVGGRLFFRSSWSIDRLSRWWFRCGFMTRGFHVMHVVRRMSVRKASEGGAGPGPGGIWSAHQVVRSWC